MDEKEKNVSLPKDIPPANKNVLSTDLDEIEVTKENPFIIDPEEGSNVIYNIKKLTLMPGGKIICKTSVTLNVDIFIKK